MQTKRWEKRPTLTVCSLEQTTMYYTDMWHVEALLCSYCWPSLYIRCSWIIDLSTFLLVYYSCFFYCGIRRTSSDARATRGSHITFEVTHVHTIACLAFFPTNFWAKDSRLLEGACWTYCVRFEAYSSRICPLPVWSVHFLTSAECIRMTSRQPCWCQKQQSGDHNDIANLAYVARWFKQFFTQFERERTRRRRRENDLSQAPRGFATHFRGFTAFLTRSNCLNRQATQAIPNQYCDILLTFEHFLMFQYFCMATGRGVKTFYYHYLEQWTQFRYIKIQP